MSERIDRYREGIAIDIGFSCNNNCIFCVNEQGHLRSFDLSTGEVRAMLEEIKTFFDGIIFNGGEPSIRPDIVDLVSYAKKIGFKTIMLISNGRMFAYPDYCAYLFAAGLNLVFVTIEASCAALHDRLTTVKGSFKETIQGIRNLKKSGIEVYTNTVINKINYRNLPHLPLFLARLNIPYAKLSFIRAKGSNLRKKGIDTIVPNIRDVVPFVRKTADNFIKLGLDFTIQEIPPCIMKTHIPWIRKGAKMPQLQVPPGRKKEDFIKKYDRRGNIKLPHCRSCCYDNECLGPWEEYTDHFGTHEFTPVRKNN